MKYIISIVVLVLLGLGVFFLIVKEPALAPVEQPNEDPNIVISYISANISELSPEKEVLGGTFYITNISLDSGRGTVEYEDGHIALVADFSYSFSEKGEVQITRFEIVE